MIRQIIEKTVSVGWMTIFEDAVKTRLRRLLNSEDGYERKKIELSNKSKRRRRREQRLMPSPLDRRNL